MTMMDPDPVLGSEHWPVGDGKFPTRTNPPRRMFNAVVRPVGVELWKKSDNGALGGTSTMVVPVPWRFPPVMVGALLKFDTRTSPGWIVPPAGKLRGTKATPYGFPSPLAGTVDTTRVGPGRNGWSSSSASNTAVQSRQDATARANTFHRPGFLPVENFESIIRFIWAISRFILTPFL